MAEGGRRVVPGLDRVIVSGVHLPDLVTDAATEGFRGLDASMLPGLRVIRCDGPARARRARCSRCCTSAARGRSTPPT